MDYVYDLTIPPNTSKDDPEELKLPTFSGVIHLVEIGFPPGPANKVHVAVKQGLHQVWPSNPDGSYHWDNRVYSKREHYPIGRDAPSLVLQGWSPGATKSHTIQFSFSVLPVEIMEPWRVQLGILDTLLKLLGIRPKGSKR